MKKHIFIVFALLLSGEITIAGNESESLKSSSSGEKCFDENTHLINAGISFGGVGYYKYPGVGTYRRSPIFNVSYEQPWKQRLGPGYLGVGAYVSYQSQYYYRKERSPYDWQWYNYESHWTNLTLAGRAVYHWDVLNSERAEVYAGVLIGVRVNLYRYETNDPNPSRTAYEINSSYVWPAWGAFAGARWYFVKKVALFVEAGHGVSNVTGGFTFKF